MHQCYSVIPQETAPRILLVDDVPINCAMLDAHMSRAGFRCTSAGGGAEALELIGIDEDGFNPPPFDIVILDIMMPGVDGLEVLQRIRRAHPPELLPVIMATSKTNSEDVVDALSLGANDYVLKPIDIPALLARLNTHLKLRQTLLTLRQTQDSLVESAKMESIGRIAAGVAHEVKNPLYVLQMGVDYFSMVGDTSNEATRKTINNMQNAIERADTIIRSMLDFSRSEELKLEFSEINQIIDDSLVLIKHQIKNKQIQLDLQFEPDLPTVNLDRVKIGQVIINLISNACDAMNEGGHLLIKTCRIGRQSLPNGVETIESRKIREMQDGVMIEIIDDGPGIPHEFMFKLYDPFFTSKPAGEGTGLGLSITKTIIDLHDGHIEISNMKERGARVCISLSTCGPMATPITPRKESIENITKRHALRAKPHRP